MGGSDVSPVLRRVKILSRPTFAQCQEQMVLTGVLRCDQPSRDVEGCPVCICAVGSHLSLSEALPTPLHRGGSWAPGVLRPWRSVWPQRPCLGNRGLMTRVGNVTSQGTLCSSGQFSVQGTSFLLLSLEGPQTKLHCPFAAHDASRPPCNFQVLTALFLHGAGDPMSTQTRDSHPGWGWCLGQAGTWTSSGVPPHQPYSTRTC